MNKSTAREHPRVRLDGMAMVADGYAVLPPGAARVLLQMLREASQAHHEVHSQPPLAA